MNAGVINLFCAKIMKQHNIPAGLTQVFYIERMDNL